MTIIESIVRRLTERVGLEIRPAIRIPEASEADRSMMRGVRAFSMSSDERLWSTIISARYVARNRIEGAFVECGVWRGGQSLLAALTFLEERSHRPLWLFDTFEGMTEPTRDDVNFRGESARATFERQRGRGRTWAAASLEDVRDVMKKAPYPAGLIHYVRGPVEKTLREPDLPDAIAVLRLDTDWYESTRDELAVLYPRLVSRGVLIVDDYGHYAGARKAVDEYFQSIGVFPLLQPIDYTGRIFVKP